MYTYTNVRDVSIWNVRYYAISWASESEEGLDIIYFFVGLAPPPPFQLASDVNGFLRNECNIFSDDRGINQKRTENCINARSALMQKFSVLFSGLFSVDTSINRENIRFISYHLIFISISFHCKNHFNFLTNQNKRYAITLINIKWFKGLLPLRCIETNKILLNF